jgi:hypothetical protein
MKLYKPLPIPEDSAWERKTWRSYTPSWLLNFIDGIANIFKWIPVLYKDKNWDWRYIYELMEFKLLQQRDYLVKANRHMSIPEINRDITLCLNLIQRVKDEYYGCEYLDYFEAKHWFEPTDETGQYFTCHSEMIWEKFDEYLAKYPIQHKKVLQKYADKIEEKKDIAFYIGLENEKRAQNLLYKILNRKLSHWWD